MQPANCEKIKQFNLVFGTVLIMGEFIEGFPVAFEGLLIQETERRFLLANTFRSQQAAHFGIEISLIDVDCPVGRETSRIRLLFE